MFALAFLITAIAAVNTANAKPLDNDRANCKWKDSVVGYIKGRNIEIVGDMSVDECKKRCLETDNCISFDYRTDEVKCWLSDFNTETVELEKGNSYQFYYELDCKNEPCVEIYNCITIGERLGNPDADYDLSEQTSLAMVHGRVSKITVYSGYVVDGIEFTYGTYKAPRIGGPLGHAATFTLESDEVITEVNAQFYPSTDGWKNCLCQLNFVTSKNNVHGPYGYGGGDGDLKKATGDSLVTFRYGVGTEVVDGSEQEKCLKMLAPIFNAC